MRWMTWLAVSARPHRRVMSHPRAIKSRVPNVMAWQQGQ
jgi:hypothetical protein